VIVMVVLPLPVVDEFSFPRELRASVGAMSLYVVGSFPYYVIAD
jgi:hypothetical protein